MRLFITLLCVFYFAAAMAQEARKGPAPIELQVDYVEGMLVFMPSDACLAETCHTNVQSLKEALTHINFHKADNRTVNSFLPVKIGSTRFYLTTYHYPFSSAAADTILRLENDSIMIHDVGADGLLSDSTKEYCVNKKTQQRFDWYRGYSILMEAGVCPVDCFMRGLHAQGYQGYILQMLKDGHTAIMYY